jgi:thioredoxin-like negative regulator of GroEL
VTGKTFKAQVLQSAKTVLVDYRAKRHGPCKIIAPIPEAIAEEQGGHRPGLLDRFLAKTGLDLSNPHH